MATPEAHAPREHEELQHHPSPKKYVWIAIILAFVTALEVGIYYVPALESVLVPSLIVFAVIKFIMVALYFMHLKFDSKVFRRFFVTGIVLAFVVFGVVLVLFFYGPEAPGLTGG